MKSPTFSTENKIKSLLEQSSLHSTGVEIKPGAIGGNNRIDIVEVNRKTYVAKWYFAGHSHERDRLASEWAFLRFAKKAKIDKVPEALGYLPKERIALYGFIQGRKLQQHEINREYVGMCGQFIADLNHPDSRIHAGDLSAAAEAFWAISGHQENVEQRLLRLKDVPVSGNPERELHTILKNMRETWLSVTERLQSREKTGELSLGYPMADSARIVSPSDFGFHNVLLASDGQLRFIDFEYAGWDDPAKMLCDFFLQPAIKVPFEYFEIFCDSALQHYQGKDEIVQRSRLMMPIFAMKWCCIILNPFMPEWAERNKFTDENIDIDRMKEERIKSAKSMLDMCRVFIDFY